MLETVTGLVTAGHDWEDTLAEADRCVRIEAREAEAACSDKAGRLAAGSCDALLDRLLAGELHNGVLSVSSATLCSSTAATAARTCLARGLERVLLVDPQPVLSEDPRLLHLSPGQPLTVLERAVQFRPELVVLTVLPSSPPLARQLSGLVRLLVILQAGHQLTAITLRSLRGADSLCLLYDSEMEKHFTEATYTSHNGITLRPYPEGPQRIQGIWRALKEAKILEHRKVSLVETGRLVTQSECCLVHTEKFWTDWLETDSLSQPERDRLASSMDSIYLNPSSVRCARLAAGGVLQCLDQLVSGHSEAGFAVVRPPGHHAEADCSAGFCIFNNVAIGAKYAATHHGLERILILDWDVHHGNGTQHMFYRDSKVLYMSLHRYDHGKFYPCSEEANYDRIGEGPGEGFNVNIPWNGLQFGDSEYMLAFLQVVLPIACEFRPQLTIISAGFDAARGDPLSGYCVSPEMFGFMTHQLRAAGEGRVLVVLEGGYNVETISQASLCCSEALLGLSERLVTPQVTEPRQSAVQTVSNVISSLSPHWQSLDRTC